MSVLVIVRGMPYTGKTKWAQKQIELLTKDHPTYLFEPHQFCAIKIPGRDNPKRPGSVCLSEVYRTFSQSRKAVVFVTDVFMNERSLAPYTSVHCKYKILVETVMSPTRDISDKKYIRLNEGWQAPESMSIIDKFNSTHYVDTIETTLDTPYLCYLQKVADVVV